VNVKAGRFLKTFALTVSTLGANGTAYAETADPSPEAMILAKALDRTFINVNWGHNSTVMFESGSLEKAEKKILFDLLRNGPVTGGLSCHSGIPACLEAANRTAKELAPDFVLMLQNAIVREYAKRFDKNMSSEEMNSAVDFLITRGGKSFIKALNINQYNTVSIDYKDREIREVFNYSSRSFTEDRRGAFDEETKNLPRARGPFVVQMPNVSEGGVKK
jgi:hypothetical protein